MNSTFKSIRLICIIVCYFSIFNSNLLAVDYFRYRFIEQLQTIHIKNTTKAIKKCKESRANNFNDRKPEERIILNYLNVLLDKITSSNKNILEKFGRSPEEFCIDKENIGSSSFANAGLGLIVIDISEEYLFLKHGREFSESYVISSITHELAHDLLNHILQDLIYVTPRIYDTSSFKEDHKDINEYEFDGDLNDPKEEARFRWKYKYNGVIALLFFPGMRFELREEFKEWKKFYSSHPDYVKIKQRYEIDADNLSLTLYLNTGFILKDFEKYHLAGEYYYTNPKMPEIYKMLFKDDTYITVGEQAIKVGKFKEFMDSIKYLDPEKDYHPIDFWRYWNARTQREIYKKNNYNYVDSDVVNGFYFRVNLSKFKKLTELQSFLSNQDNLNNEIISKKDPRFYLINKLLSSKELDYTLEFLPRDKDNVGRIQSDGTVLFRAYDIFHIALIKNDIFKKINPCIRFFMEFKENSYKKMYEPIKKTFIK